MKTYFSLNVFTSSAASILLILLLSACATTPAIKTAPEQLNLQAASQRIQNYANADLKGVIFPYVGLVKQLNSVTGSNICEPQNIAIYQRMYSLNQSSLYALYLLIACEQEDQQKLDNYLAEFEAIITVLLNQHNGASVAEAVNIREISEAELILSSAGYSILDSEIMMDENRIVYRYHVVDNDSGEFEYHYYNNFDHLKRLMSSVNQFLTDKQVSMLTLREFSKQQHSLAYNFFLNALIDQQDYLSVVDKYADKNELSPISQLNLAKAYFYLEKNDALAELTDNIVDQKDFGDIHSSVFIAEVLLKFSEGSENQELVNQILGEVDRRTESGRGAFMLAQSFYRQNNNQQTKFWVDKAVAQNYQKFYQQTRNLLN